MPKDGQDSEIWRPNQNISAESPVSKQRRNGLLAGRAGYALAALTRMSAGDAEGRPEKVRIWVGLRVRVNTEQSEGLL